MYQNIYIPKWYGVWYYKFGDIIENQQTGEQYLIIEEPIKDMINKSGVLNNDRIS